uniref:Transcriptional adapter 2-alpha/beta-like domain-containing protein n=1 Tax=Panagrolaimus superbus TaxID=310955 RepID=A0A914YSG7_9BILA
MSDIGIHIRENDPLCALRRPISGEHAEKFRMNFTPDNVLELKKTMPVAKTKFSDILDIAETLEVDNDISHNSTTIFRPQSPKVGPSPYRNTSMKAKGSEDEDELFQEVLDTVYQNALKGKTERIRLQKPIVPNDMPFNPYKFCAYIRDKNKLEKQRQQEETTKNKDVFENKGKNKKSLKKKGKETSRIRLSESDDDLMDASDYTDDIETPKRNPQTAKRKVFKNPLKHFEKKRIAHARYRRQLREADTHVKKILTSKLNSEGEEDDNSNIPESELTAKSRAHKRLDNLLETFHKNMGFQSDDDWGSDIDDQFANALDGCDRDYDEASRLHIRQVGNTTIDKPIPPYKNQLIKQQLRNLNSKLSKKWKADFTVTSHGVSKFEKVYPSASEQVSRDPTDGFYDIYEAPYRPFTNQEGKELLTESELDAVTYNQRRHDYEVENKNDAESVLTSVTKRHEPIDFSNMVNMAKVNSYQRVLKERDSQSSFAREYGLLPAFMDYTKKVTYPLGHTPDIDQQFEEVGLSELKDKYRPLLLPIRQVVTKPMFDEYLHNLLRVEELKKRLSHLQELQKSGETRLPTT